MKTKILSTLLLLSLLAFALSACATSTCRRRDNWFAKSCVGTDVTYVPDATCEDTLKQCDAPHVQAFESYVACLESQKTCSLQGVSSCAQQYPGGVNLMCPKAG